MIKQLGIIYIALCMVTLYLGAEETSLEEYESLNPEIDLLSDRDVGTMGRKLLFYRERASFSDAEYAYIYDMAKNTAVKMPSEQAGLIPYTRITYFWDPHTKINYGYFRNFPRNDLMGWYLIRMEANDRIYLSHQSKDEYWAYRSPPYREISDSRILISKYSGYMRDRPSERISEFNILDKHTKEKIWEYPIVSNTFTSLYTDLYWITGSWFLSIDTPAIAGIWKTDSIFNYETNEEISFAPESIIGYGNGVILTTLQTEKGFTGITIWSVDKEILYCDKDYPLTGMLDVLHKNFPGMPTIAFSYYDFPYIYCNITDAYLYGGGYTTLIMNLKDKKTYMSPEGYYVHGIFEPE
ncbi:MAG: hypothetical protein LBQ46_08065 [Treponema sp.]|jgi:hypothetical protein|nr:hypothetical protein [Treponema sp.]